MLIAAAISFEYLISYSLLHQVNLALFQQLKQCVVERHHHHYLALLRVTSQTFQSMSPTANGHGA